MCNTSYKQMRADIISNDIFRALVLSWYDGSLQELFSYDQRYMLSRLYSRAIGEIEYRLHGVSRAMIRRSLRSGSSWLTVLIMS